MHPDYDAPPTWKACGRMFRPYTKGSGVPHLLAGKTCLPFSSLETRKLSLVCLFKRILNFRIRLGLTPEVETLGGRSDLQQTRLLGSQLGS